jgi:uncharacterized membrane protein
MRALIAGLTLGLLIVHATSASASVRLCNRSGRDIWATWGEQGTNNNQIAIGWFHLTPNQCKVPISGCICNFAASLFGNCRGMYSFHAHDANGAVWSTGDNGRGFVCTTNNAFYENPIWSHEGLVCPAGRSWLQWGIGSYPTQPFCDFTFNFNP